MRQLSWNLLEPAVPDDGNSRRTLLGDVLLQPQSWMLELRISNAGTVRRRLGKVTTSCDVQAMQAAAGDSATSEMGDEFATMASGIAMGRQRHVLTGATTPTSAAAAPREERMLD